MGKSERRRVPSRKKGTGNPNETVDALGYRRMVEGKPGARRSRPTPIGNILPQIIARYGLGRKLSSGRFQEAFRNVLTDLFPRDETGFSIDDSYRILGLRGGVLRISVTDAPLMSEFAFYKGEILRRMRLALPEEKIREIRFTLINN
ncbi:MAG: DUF721 domain-containing protein [Thermoguttaceae bacterium]|nr:DUF721 domain-containing protein [Thermoguttaceae bacterium]